MTAIHPRLTVLLAEDDENDIVLIRRILEKLGLLSQLLTVADGEQALTYFRALSIQGDRNRYPWPELVLLDHRMPRVSGLDVLFWLRTQALFKHLPVLILSGGLNPQERSILQRLNALHCHKSCSPGELTQKLSTCVQATLNGDLDAGSFQGPLPSNAANLRTVAARP